MDSPRDNRKNQTTFSNDRNSSPKNNFDESNTFSKKEKNIPVDEGKLKKKLLNSLEHEEKDTIETFKKYVKELISRKLAQLQQSKETPDQDKIKNLLKLKAEAIMSNFQKKNENNPELQENIANPEDAELVNSQMNHEKIIQTSRKLRDRMKTEKIDKASKFYQSKIKHFSNLDTFINAKEFFEDLNPYKDANTNRQSTAYKSKKHLLTLKKLQKESNDFYDKRMQEFTERMNELNSLTVGVGKDKEEKESVHSLTKSSSSSSSSSLIEKNGSNNWTRMSINARNSQLGTFSSMSNIHAIKANFSDNISFLEHQLGMNKSVVDFFKEFYNPNGQIKMKRHKTKESEVDTMRSSVMRRLLVTDNSLNRLECQLENNEDFNQLDGFYNQTLDVLNHEKNNARQKNKFQKEEMELDSLKRLEKFLEEMLQKNQKKKKKGGNLQESLKRYQEFQEKSNHLVNLIGNTSRTIFNEKHKEFTEKVDKHLKAYKRRSMGNITMNKTGSLLIPIPGLYLTELDQKFKEEKEEEALFKKSPKKAGNHFKSSSISLPLNIKQTEIRNENKKKSIPELTSDTRVKRLSVYESKWKNDPNIVNQNANTFIPTSKKRVIRTISHIIDKTDNIREKYKDQRKTFYRLETEYNKFYQDTNKRIDVPLESIIMTLEKPKYNFKFNIFKPKPLVSRKKHAI